MTRPRRGTAAAPVNGPRDRADVSNVPADAVRDVGPALYGQVDSFDGSALTPDKMMPKDRKDWFQSENERLKFEESIGEVAQTADVARQMSIMAKAVVSTLDGLPDLLERDCGLTPKAVEKVQDVVDTLRDQMYLQVIADDE